MSIAHFWLLSMKRNVSIRLICMSFTVSAACSLVNRADVFSPVSTYSFSVTLILMLRTPQQTIAGGCGLSAWGSPYGVSK